MNVEEVLAALARGDRTAISRTITLAESEAPAHRQQADAILSAIMPGSFSSLRVGITGVPGVGKSTFIEGLGLRLLEQGKRVAVLAVDPSSSLSGGSILGDKTRMPRLSREANCFIRPSPSRGVLGGVARGTLEAMLVLEAAGYDVVIVETVGVGQSETAVRNLVDCFALLMLPNAGDGLQGVKRGIMELADLIFVNKADGESRAAADLARMELEQSVACLRPATSGWTTPVLSGSALSGDGLAVFMDTLARFEEVSRKNGVFSTRRKAQFSQWLRARVTQSVLDRFWRNADVCARLAQVEARWANGEVDIADELEEILRLSGV